MAEIVFDRGLSGVPRQKAVDLADQQLNGLTAGVNAAHRVAPLAMAAFIADDQLEAAAREESALTHAHRLAGDTAAAVATLCRRLLRGVEWAAALEAAAVGKSQPVVTALRPASSTLEALSDGGFAPETLKAAVWHLNAAHSFERALSSSLEFAGPANYCPVLVGAMGGARWGVGKIPPQHLQEHPVATEIRAAAQQLSTLWFSRPDSR